MILRIFLALLFGISATTGAEWKLALPGYQYEFPRDHYSHPGFKTEWWYFTGNLATAEGKRFGYQLTFFRQGIRPHELNETPKSRWIQPDFYFAHFAVSDLSTGKFRHFQKVSRAAFEEAGATLEGERVTWNGDWEMLRIGPELFRIRATAEGVKLDLTLRPTKPWVTHGADGVSQKAAGLGQASHYYSYPRMSSSGVLELDRKYEVQGESWMDREWATNQLAENQVGWDWFSIQFEDGSELMLYQMRLRDGGADPTSSGTYVKQDGSTVPLVRDDYKLTPTRFWTSPETKAIYPVEWKIEIPKLSQLLTVKAAFDAQELVERPVVYWEGATEISGVKENTKINGRGYLELTGYFEPLKQLRETP